MFRFSIRELMLVTLAVAMGVAWFTEHRRLEASLVNAKSLKKEVDAAKRSIDFLVRNSKEIDEELNRHGLLMFYLGNSGPSLSKYNPDGSCRKYSIADVSSTSP